MMRLVILRSTNTIKKKNNRRRDLWRNKKQKEMQYNIKN